MKKIVLIFCLVMLSTSPAFATFSIVAMDPDTGEMGVAVASRYFSVGSVVPWAEAGVGAVATQARVNVGYGPRALELLKEGLSAQEVLERLFVEDVFPGKEGRQIAIVDRNSNIAVYTGDAANDWRGHRKGENYSVQGNILVGPEVVEAMAKAFENTEGELTERLYAALLAGDSVGGDRRGRQSASILVVGKELGRNTNNDRYAYVNVDDHSDPFGELRRLLDIQLGINYSTRLRRSLGANDADTALLCAERLIRYRPLSGNAFMDYGFLLYLNGKADSAVYYFRRANGLLENFKEMWEQMVSTSAYESVDEDIEFKNEVFRVQY